MFDTVEGFRHQLIATDTPAGGTPLAWLDARHRTYAQVEDRIIVGTDTGFGRFPSRVLAINTAWLELALTAIDLLAWTRALLLDGDLASAEPKKLRYRILHTAARITRPAPHLSAPGRGLALGTRPGRSVARLAALPRPIIC